ERNSYGILSGMKKDDAKNKYPWLVETLNKGDYVYGSERIEDTNERAEKAFEILITSGLNNLAILTHGKFLKAILPIITGKKLTKKEDGGFILLNIEGNSNEVIAENGIEIS
ncbi:histidine phosphatase family protein, partial [Patescibacteria group bacterium]